MGLDGVDPAVVQAHLASPHLHHKANSIGPGKVDEDPEFLAKIAESLQASSEVLIVGPGIEKTALFRHLQAQRPELSLRLESSDHPTDNEIIALGRRHFRLDAVRA